jgi:adenine-specific DNA-methyltransferase
MFAQELSPPGEHFMLLDGIRGSFGLSEQKTHEEEVDGKSLAWSCGVLHHVVATPEHVIVRRWDRPETSRYTRRSVTERLDRFYAHLAESQALPSRTIATHAVEAFGRLRSNFPTDKQQDALAVFLLLLGSMLHSDDDTYAHEHAVEITHEFRLNDDAPNSLQRVSPELLRHVVSGFRRPLFAQPQQVETKPSLMVRHAGAMVFQEAHFHLIQQGPSDMFGVPTAAAVALNTGNGVHFTPPGLARAIVEQALDSYGELPRNLTILDAACGSGSILHEALRTLRDRQCLSKIKIVGFDESEYAVQMTRFSLSSAMRDWPELDFSIVVELRNSLDEQEWPEADLILMNPPFVSLRDLNSEQRRLLTNVLGSYAKGRPDLSMAFVERGVQSLAPGGVLGTLVPAGVLGMTFAQEWRRHLLDEASVSFLAVFGELGLFRLATVETGCVVLRKGVSDDAGLYKSLWVGEKRNTASEALRFLRRATIQESGGVDSEAWTLAELPRRALKDGANWRPSPQTLRRELQKIDARVPTTVSSLFDVKQGALPAPREAFIIPEERWHQLPAGERAWFRRVAENQNIRAGQVLPGDWIFYPRSPELPHIDSEASLLEAIPVFGPHLLRFKPTLQQRRGKHERWWELGEDRKWLRVPSKKIVSTYFGKSGSFAYDADGDRIVVQGYGWLPKWKPPRSLQPDYLFAAYIAIFNSELFTQLLAEVCPTVGGGQLNLSKRYSERVRLPDLLERVETSPSVDVLVRELSFFGGVIGQAGLPAVPRSKLEELVRVLYGV